MYSGQDSPKSLPFCFDAFVGNFKSASILAACLPSCIYEWKASVLAPLDPTIQNNMRPSFRKQTLQMSNGHTEHFAHERAAFVAILCFLYCEHEEQIE